MTLHNIALHYITHYTTLHYIALHYITIHYITLQYLGTAERGAGLRGAWTRAQPRTLAVAVGAAAALERGQLDKASARRVVRCTVSCWFPAPALSTCVVCVCVCVVPQSSDALGRSAEA